MQLSMKITEKPFDVLRADLLSANARLGLFRDVSVFLQRSAKDNARAKGGKSFWNGIANSVTDKISADELIVGSSHFAARHKQFGGDISAPGKGPGSKHSNFLAIPLNAKARGKFPKTFKDLWCYQAASGNLFLVKTVKVKTGSKAEVSERLKEIGHYSAKNVKSQMYSSKLEFYYLLKKQVTQKAYPWFPLGDEAKKEVSKGIKLWLSRRVK